MDESIIYRVDWTYDRFNFMTLYRMEVKHCALGLQLDSSLFPISRISNHRYFYLNCPNRFVKITSNKAISECQFLPPNCAIPVMVLFLYLVHEELSQIYFWDRLH